MELVEQRSFARRRTHLAAPLQRTTSEHSPLADVELVRTAAPLTVDVNTYLTARTGRLPDQVQLELVLNVLDGGLEKIERTSLRSYNVTR